MRNKHSNQSYQINIIPNQRFMCQKVISTLNSSTSGEDVYYITPLLQLQFHLLSSKGKLCQILLYQSCFESFLLMLLVSTNVNCLHLDAYFLVVSLTEVSAFYRDNEPKQHLECTTRWLITIYLEKGEWKIITYLLVQLHVYFFLLLITHTNITSRKRITMNPPTVTEIEATLFSFFYFI